jgi:sigma-E factor negative regulatory protein RseC
MASLAKTVEHLGRVQEITLNDIKVAIQPQSSCAGCQAQAVCGVDSDNEKFIVVHRSNHNYIVGETVKVIMQQSMGFWALFVAYILPFIFVIAVLIALTQFGTSEGLSGLLALLVLVPYYFLVYYFRGNISKKINFDIQKI